MQHTVNILFRRFPVSLVWNFKLSYAVQMLQSLLRIWEDLITFATNIQCDQIGGFIGLWASFKAFGNN